MREYINKKVDVALCIEEVIICGSSVEFEVDEDWKEGLVIDAILTEDIAIDFLEDLGYVINKEN